MASVASFLQPAGGRNLQRTGGRRIQGGPVRLQGGSSSTGIRLQGGSPSTGIRLQGGGGGGGRRAPARRTSGGGGGGGSTGGGGGGSSGPSAAQIRAQQQAARDNRLRKAINATYLEKVGFLKGQRGRLKNTSKTLKKQVGKQFGTSKNILDRSLAQGKENIAHGREKVRLQSADTLKDLAQNIRSALEAGNVRLGVAGASDSSAAPLLSFALTKLQNQNRSDVLNQANEQLGDLDLEERNLVTDFGNQLLELKQARDDRLNEIALDFRDKIEAINAQIINASGTRREALANLRTSVATDALNKIKKIDSNVNGFVKRLTQVAETKLGDIQSQRLSQTASDFNPEFGFTPVGADDVNIGSRLESGSLDRLNFFRPRNDDEE